MTGTPRPPSDSELDELTDEPAVGVAPAAPQDPSSTRSLFTRRRRSSSGPAGTRPGTAPSAAATVGVRRVRRISAKDRTAPKVVRSKSQLVRQVVVLALVFFAVAFAVAVPLRNYLSERAELAATVTAEQQLRAQLAGLQAKQQSLSDPAFIMSQATRRLQYVKPGSTVYVVNAPPLAAAKPADAAARELMTPWYSQLWNTLADPVAPGTTGTGSDAPSSSVAPKAGR